MQTYLINEIVPDYSVLIEWDKREIRQFWNNTLKITDFRIRQLQDLIHQNPTYSDLSLDFSPLTLIPIGKWLKENVTTKPRSQEAYETALKRFRGMGEPSPYELSDLTKSICFDIAIYYGETMLRQLRDKEWFINNNVSRRDIDFGTMGIRFGKYNVIFSPFNLTLGQAFQITVNKFNDKDLYTFFHIQLDTIIASEYENH